MLLYKYNDKSQYFVDGIPCDYTYVVKKQTERFTKRGWCVSIKHLPEYEKIMDDRKEKEEIEEQAKKMLEQKREKEAKELEAAKNEIIEKKRKEKESNTKKHKAG